MFRIINSNRFNVTILKNIQFYHRFKKKFPARQGIRKHFILDKGPQYIPWSFQILQGLMPF